MHIRHSLNVNYHGVLNKFARR